MAATQRSLKILVTGGCGFIGSNFCRYVLTNRTDWTIFNLDKLSYAGNSENLAEFLGHSRYSFLKGDACDAELARRVLAEGFNVIVNFAAETHVDRSIAEPHSVVKNNIILTEVLLSAARESGIGKFVHIGTDEVYGSLTTGRFTESSPLRPSNPYSASKAAADLLCMAYRQTYNLPVVVARCSNNYGPYQFPEKLIPLFVTNALEDKPLPLYGDGLNVRDWIFVEDFCRAIDAVIADGKVGEVYNVGGASEISNLEIARTILDCLDKPHSLITFVKDRPGHDRRYAMDFTKIRGELGWEPRVNLNEGLPRTVNWYRENREWWRRVKTGEYLEFYRKHYFGTHGLIEQPRTQEEKRA